MRTITDHKVNGLNDAVAVHAFDAPGSGGACHLYDINVGNEPSTIIRFQNGPVAETGFNGLSNESLLAVVIDRLRGFQSGDYKCRENACALTKLDEAMMWLHKRTRGRMARGVEGTYLN